MSIVAFIDKVAKSKITHMFPASLFALQSDPVGMLFRRQLHLLVVIKIAFKKCDSSVLTDPKFVTHRSDQMFIVAHNDATTRVVVECTYQTNLMSLPTLSLPFNRIEIQMVTRLKKM